MKYTVIVLVLVVMACSMACAQNQKPEEEQPKASIAISYGLFMPVGSEARDRFGDSWNRFSITSFDMVKPERWRFMTQGTAYSVSGDNDLRLYAVSAGMEHGYRVSDSVRMYLSATAGPYYGKIHEDATGFSDSHLGLNANLSVGTVIRQKVYIEARYEHYSRFAGISLDGFSASIGLKLFDLK